MEEEFEALGGREGVIGWNIDGGLFASDSKSLGVINAAYECQE